MRSCGLALAIALLSAAPVVADAPEARAPENRADLQCMAVYAVIAGLNPEDVAVQMGAIGAMMFYAGRLDGRAPSIDWLDQLKQFILNDVDESFKLEAVRCGEEMIEIGGELTTWGAEMQSLGAKMDAGKQP